MALDGERVLARAGTRMRIRRGGSLRRSNPASPDFDPDQSPFFHIARVLGQYSQRMDGHLKKRGLDMARWRVLNLVRTTPNIPISKLAETAVMRLPTTTKLVKRMVDEGLLLATGSTSDARVTELALSDEGERRLAEVQDTVAVIFEQALDGVDDSEVAFVVDLMRHIHGNMLL